MIPNEVRDMKELLEQYAKAPPQGLKTVRKRIKKSPNHLGYRFAEIDFLNLCTQYAEAAETMEALCKDDHFHLDMYDLANLQSYLVESRHGGFPGSDSLQDPPKYITAAWTKMMTGKPDHILRVAQCMIEGAWIAGWFPLLQTAFVRLQKEFRDEPKYHYSWISITFLYGFAIKHDPLLSNLVIASTQKLVKDTIAKKEGARKITDRRQLRFLLHVWKEMNRNDLIIETLQSPDLGFGSDLCGHDLEFFQCLCDAFVATDKYAELDDLCYHGLTDFISTVEAGTCTQHLEWANDLALWIKLLDCEPHLKAESPEIVTRNELLRTRFKEQSIDNTNQLKDLWVRNVEPFADPSLCFLSELAAAFNAFPPDSGLDGPNKLQSSEHWLDLVKPITAKDSPDAYLSTFKYMFYAYYHWIAAQRQHKADSQPWLPNFPKSLPFAQCFNEITNPQLLLFFTLYHMDEYRQNTDPATLSSDFIVLSVLLKQALGLIASAADDFEILGTKEIQLHSINWMLLTHIPIHHPFPWASRAKRLLISPLTALDETEKHQLKSIEKAKAVIGPTPSLFPFDQLTENWRFLREVETSSTAMICGINRRRIQRITNSERVDHYELLHTQHAQDARDFSIFPGSRNKGEREMFIPQLTRVPAPARAGGERVWLPLHVHAVEAGSVLKELLHQLQLNDLVQTLLTVGQPIGREALANFAATYALVADSKSTQLDGYAGWRLLARLCAVMLDDECGTKVLGVSGRVKLCQLFEETFAELESWMATNAFVAPEKRHDLPNFFPQAEDFEDIWLHLEFLRAIATFAAAFSPKDGAWKGVGGRWMAGERVAAMAATAKEDAVAIKEFATSWGSKLKTSGVKHLVDLVRAGTNEAWAQEIVDEVVTNLKSVQKFDLERMNAIKTKKFNQVYVRKQLFHTG